MEMKIFGNIPRFSGVQFDHIFRWNGQELEIVSMQSVKSNPHNAVSLTSLEFGDQSILSIGSDKLK
ncbi:hypothetical protein T01_13790 [Trichinella spiralis]|uniref:Uncharacterized protein n=1 Tax=Trichinella spiralis TaxID=6334 RepID=A0A0V1BXA2_TRISP|nr:hypothetical protein T01_13790 [Trichinella spiralis]